MIPSGVKACITKDCILDTLLLLIATACFTVLVIKFCPRIIIISKWWFISILVVSLARFCYRIWAKR